MSVWDTIRREDPGRQPGGSDPARLPFGTPDAEDLLQDEQEQERPWETEPQYTRGEKFFAMMGAMSAALLIGAVYVIGLGIVIILMVSLWK